jgi:hypothetical protein
MFATSGVYRPPRWPPTWETQTVITFITVYKRLPNSDGLGDVDRCEPDLTWDAQINRRHSLLGVFCS